MIAADYEGRYRGQCDRHRANPPVGGFAPGGDIPSRRPRRSWPGCSAFSSQSEAQSAWEADGRPARADGDSDGRVCESLPSTSPSAGGSPSAQTPSSPGAALPTSPAAPAPGSVTTRVSPLQDPRGIHPSLTPVPAGQRARARESSVSAPRRPAHRPGTAAASSGLRGRTRPPTPGVTMAARPARRSCTAICVR